MNKKGMTLIELVIAIALTTLLIAAMAGIFYPVTKMFDNQRRQSELKDYANQTIVVLKEEIRDAKDIKLSNQNKNNMACYFTNPNGQIKVMDKTATSDNLIDLMPSNDLIKGYKAKLEFAKINSNSVKIVLSILDEDTGAFVKSYEGSASTINPKIVINGDSAKRLCIKK